MDVRPAYRYAATVIDVHDGDTYKLDIDLGFHTHIHVSVRLLGWNCPELSQEKGKQAREFAKALLISAKQIIVETEKDAQTFSRWLGHVYFDGRDLGQVLHDGGLAEKRN